MGTATLALLAIGAHLSGMGVLFGWQPMPDGSDKVEYIVQIEPELAATLREGQSIPITSDIPDDIGPIGRIRIVVGRDDLPRQNIATRMKPWPEDTSTAKKSRDGLVETQFTVPQGDPSGAGRYGNEVNNNTILPPDDTNEGWSNPFANTVQQGKQDARAFANDVKNEILPPSGPSSDQLFGSGNGASPGLQNAINNTRNQVQQGFQRGVEQVADRTSQQVRQAVNDLGQGASNAIDNFGQSYRNQQNGSDQSILPPGSDAAGQSSNAGPQLNQPQQPPRQPPQTQPSAPSTSFAGGDSQPGANPSSQPGKFDAPWPDTSGNFAGNNPGSTPASTNFNQQPPAQSTSWQNQQQPPRTGQNSFDLASQPSNNQQPGHQNYGQSGYNPVSNPRTQEPTGTNPNQQPNGQNDSYDVAVEQRNGPAITSDMLSGANNMQNGGNNSGYLPRQAAKQPLDTRPSALGWDDPQGSSENQGNSNNFMPLALMCVLLSGSAFGNCYLFWSYFDLRSKYQGLVHGAPLRRDRYDS